jgi:hypothetical protein
MSRRGGGAVWGWLLAASLAAGLIFTLTHRDTVATFMTAAGRVVGSTEGAGGSP